VSSLDPALSATAGGALINQYGRIAWYCLPRLTAIPSSAAC
jgi:hypothetical protein